MSTSIPLSKLHANLTGAGACHKMYVGPTWEMAQTIGEKYNIMYTVRKTALSADHLERKFIASRCANLIIDCCHREVMLDAEKEELQTLYPHHKLTFVLPD